jgi:hypothetical protein
MTCPYLSTSGLTSPWRDNDCITAMSIMIASSSKACAKAGSFCTRVAMVF